ncbi:ATP-dependent DNA helicase RecG [Candidatus Aquiluna sp. UB-MaderosW2red]|uniref:ATP-dependent DNA helicase RecG n=1 Tax=Candidatus Aquiluna sp. UB-MaderosW2red TaxID=1855377 RepID=UPI000875C648|nr:ATP-dependent DNA helicase RecG [Candidatus Aquiluna sp. UB-MaderosW2red]SCX09393.1 ATP-dependent DNA helicase RecG [Candidatus Aquiluna sp. UB-MaderosW2red]
MSLVNLEGFLGDDYWMDLAQTKLANLLGDRTAKAFEKHLGLKTAKELLEHYPRRYLRRGELTAIAEIPIGDSATIVGEVVSASIRQLKGRSGSILEVLVSDGKSQISLAFFNQAWRQKDLHAGVRGMFSGKIGIFSGKLQLAHPDYELFEEEIDPGLALAWAELPIPIYPASGSLSTWKIQKSIAIILEQLPKISDPLDAGLIKANKLMALDEALRLVHEPKREVDWVRARASLRYREALQLQLQLVQKKQEALKVKADIRLPGELLGLFDKLLPFELTQGQQQVSQEIETDLASGSPMHRLLQGEVGSGKTLVALRAVLAVAESLGQSAILAPTEVLASQHYQSVLETLGPDLAAKLGVRLLTGQLGTQERKRAYLDIASGKCLLAIGTHALFTEKLSFFDLAFVVIDEQHRFGVGQREAIRAKGKTAPHVLTMTATPIPRTMAITVFGDLEISTLTELPKGRQAITTHVVTLAQPALVSRVWQRVAEEVALGRQAFVVCPRIEGKVAEETEIDPEESLDLEDSLELEDSVAPAAAAEVFEALKVNPALAGLALGLLHGRLDSDQKSAVMQAFLANETNVLVATTIIEVGVNVPNATAMVILDADRFGISQLHQLRGRIGRGADASICFLVTNAEAGSLAMERLDAVAATTDGFKLSEVDLELRGEGDVLGDIQSGGRSQLKLLRVIKDADLISEARKLAVELLERGLSPEMNAWVEESRAEALARS